MKTFTNSFKTLLFILALMAGKQSVSQTCTASFVSSLGVNGSVTFTSTSIPVNSITTQYYWSFGNGAPTFTATGNTGMNVSQSYTANGIYTVTLIVNTPATCSASTSQTIFINNTCGLVANFGLTNQGLGLVNFNSATSIGTSSTSTYLWNFGNGATSTVTSPAYTYTAPGNYTVSLTITNSASCTSTYTIPYTACLLNPTYTSAFFANGLVSLLSTSPGTNISTYYYWSAPTAINPTIINGINIPNANFTFLNNGVHSIIHGISNPGALPAGSCTLTAVQSVTVSNVCNLNANFTSGPGTNGLVSFSNNSTGTGTTTTYLWNYGDGGTSTLIASPHTYTNIGSYIVSLTAMNSATCVSTYTAVINVCPTPSFNFTVGTNGQVNFSNTSFGTNAATSYTWSFGTPSSFSTGVNLTNVSNTYTANGTYTVYLTIMTGCGSLSTNQMVTVNTVTTPCNLASNFTYSFGSNGLLFFNSTSTGTNAGTSYFWNFGNGTTGSGPSSAAIYTNNAVFTVTLTSNNNTLPLCVSTTTQLVTVNTVTAPCMLNAGFNYTVGANGQVNFSSTSTGTQAGTTYIWAYSNGTNTPNGSGANSTYTYSTNGIYMVTLFVNNNAVPTCTSSITQTINVNTITGPCNLNAAFTYSVGANGLVNFYDASTGTVNPVAYQWWINGNWPTVPNPVVLFTSNGTYSVKLLVQNTGISPICHDSIIQNIIVNTVTGPCSLTASFAHTVGANGLVNFSSTSLGTNSITTYVWNYGDGTFGTGSNSSHTYGTAGTHMVVLTAMNGSTLCVSSSTLSINITGIPCVANANFTLSPTNLPQFWTATPAYPWNVTNAVWTWGDGSSSNVLYTSHSYSAAGLYSICLSVTVSCGSSATACSTYSVYRTSSTANIININVEMPALVPVGLENLNEDVISFSLYPNPNQGIVNLELNTFNKGAIDVFVYDLSGRKVYQQIDFNLIEENHKQLDLTILPDGIYLIQVEQGGQKLNKKLIISKD